MRKENGKRGFTLIELSIVLALVAIISVMVVSFSLLASKRTKDSEKALNFMQDTTAVESVMEGWIDDMERAGATFSIEQERLVATVSGEQFTPSIENEKLVVIFSDGEKTEIDVTSFFTMTCDIKSNASGEQMFIFSLHYTEDEGGVTSARQFKFVINSYVGNNVSVGGGA